MLHSIASNPEIQAQFQKLLADVAMVIGSILGIVLVQVAQAIKNSHMNILQKMVAERLVSYAEQTITTSGVDKAAYVAAKLQEQFPNLSQEQVKHLLEAAVLNVTAQINAPTATPPPPQQ